MGLFGLNRNSLQRCVPQIKHSTLKLQNEHLFILYPFSVTTGEQPEAAV